jgi:diaminopimelate epimerase
MREWERGQGEKEGKGSGSVASVFRMSSVTEIFMSKGETEVEEGKEGEEKVSE